MRISKASTDQLQKLSADYRFLGPSTLSNILDELIDRRAEAESELRKLERALAYSNALVTVDSICAAVRDEQGDDTIWFDLDDSDPYAGDDLPTVIRYLEARGLLARHPVHRNWARVRDESEATA